MSNACKTLFVNLTRRSKTTYGEMNFWQDSAVDSEKVAVEQQLGIPVPDNRLPLDPHVYGAPR